MRPSAGIGFATIVAASVLLATAVAADAQVSFEVLHTFGDDDGTLPAAALIQGTDGALYGTTSQGGGPGFGTVFRMDADGTFSVLYEFTGDSDGAHSVAPLIQATDGDFYGTTLQGGGSDMGTIFKLSPDGTLTTLHAFTGGPDDGAFPYAALIQATDGNFYGTTSSGGAAGSGTVFQMTPDGTVTVMHAFAGAPFDGADSRAALVQATDGQLFGTTRSGGASDFGTVFQVSADSTMNVLYAFAGTDGANPDAALIQTTDGTFYGTAENGGDFNLGTAFQLGADGTLTVLHAFTGADGQNPLAPLTQTTDGSFYGTTSAGDFSSNRGTVFRLMPDGTASVLYAFSGGADGASPSAALLQAPDGSCYGTALYGGSGDMLGTVFRVTLP
jgi:uncharacterized repeat protein (TIGR03803 family)